MSDRSDRVRRRDATRGAQALILAILAITVASCGESERIVTVTDVDYFAGSALDVHAPDRGAGRPVIVLLHGAGLDRSDYSRFADRLATAGAVVFNVGWDVLPPSTLVALEEIACAVRYAQVHAREHGGEPDRMVLVGHSTASGFAGRVAMTGDDFTGACTIEASALPVGLAVLAPALTPGGPPWPHSVLGLNPDLRVGVVHGRDDRVAGLRRGERTAGLLREAGYDTVFEVVPGGHDDLVLIDRSGSAGSTSDADADERAATLTIDVILDLAD